MVQQQPRSDTKADPMKRTYPDGAGVSWAFAILCALLCMAIGYMLMDVLEMLQEGFRPW